MYCILVIPVSHRRNLVGARGVNAFPVLFLPKNNFSGYRFKEEKIKKKLDGSGGESGLCKLRTC